MPLSYLRKGTDLIVSSLIDNAYPAWYHNILAHPEVTIELGDETFQAAATVTTGSEREQLWAFMVECWPDLVAYQAKASRALPVVVLQRDQAAEITGSSG